MYPIVNAFLLSLLSTLSLSYQQNKAVEKPKPSGNPCIDNPCGPYSTCKSIGDTAACSCLPNYIGRAPNCRPECSISAECPSNLACIQQRCSDPCVGACGSHTYCSVTNHNSVCQCEPGYTGDPFSICTEIRKCKLLPLFVFILHLSPELIFEPLFHQPPYQIISKFKILNFKFISGFIISFDFGLT